MLIGERKRMIEPDEAHPMPSQAANGAENHAHGCVSSRSDDAVIRVVGAAVIHDGKVLCACRPEGKPLAGLWEFPGGKIEQGETPERALHREIIEELGCEIEVGRRLCVSTQRYDFGVVELAVFVCRLARGEVHAMEHQQVCWMDPEDLRQLAWAPADEEAVSLLMEDCGCALSD